MRVGMALNYAGGFAETIDELADYERAGLDIVYVPEAYSFDAVSQLGFIAARTERLQIASGILQLYSRTPGPDRGRARLRFRRPARARHRCVRTAGGRRLAWRRSASSSRSATEPPNPTHAPAL
jgi:hypothetical protein